MSGWQLIGTKEFSVTVEGGAPQPVPGGQATEGQGSPGLLLLVGGIALAALMASERR